MRVTWGPRKTQPVQSTSASERFRLLVAALLVMVPFAHSPAATAGDLDRVNVFNLKAQRLDRALLEFGAQAHLQVMFAWNTATREMRTKRLKGRYTGRQALADLLRGTRLTFREHGDTVEIIAKGAAVELDPSNSNQRKDSSTGTTGETPQPQYLSNNSTARKSSVARKAAYLNEVTVTGTRIKGARPVGVRIQTIDAVQIERSGYTTLDQLLQALPDDFRGGSAGASPDAIFTRGADRGNNYASGSGVNLRGLGNDATLILLNGHRIAPSGSGFFTDISTIPLAAIDHIDVLTDGSSAIYGSDAIAGVVNIILKTRNNGGSTGLRYGMSHGFSTYDADTVFGRQWKGSGFTVTADYSGQSALDVRDRPFTSSVPSPTSILPMSHQVWLSAGGHQTLTRALSLRGDMEYSDTRRLATQSYGLPAAQSISDVPRWSGSVSADYQTSGSWTVSGEFSVGEGLEKLTENIFPSPNSIEFEDRIREASRFSQGSLRATGQLFTIPGGAIKVSAGLSYLVQSFSHVDYNPKTVTRFGANRHVTSGYGELLVPVFGSSNALPALERLELSAAARYDRYSDFGGTTNYKFGISWYPIKSLQIRGAYSTSFRAPAVGQELVSSERGTLAVLLFPLLNPQQTALEPVLFPEGAQPHLKPETATNLTLGFDYHPFTMRNLLLSLNYYRIHYIDQLAQAPFSPTGLSDPALAPVITQYSSSAPVEAFVSSAIRSGAVYVDATRGMFGANPLASTEYIYDIRIGNLSRTDTSGFDLSGRYDFAVGANIIDARVAATYIKDFFTQLTPAAPLINEVDTVGYPADLRAVAQIALHRGPFHIAATANYIAGYQDTTSATPRHVGSYTTFDLVGSYDFPNGNPIIRNSRLSIAVTNLCDRNPPYVANAALGIAGVHYDAANVSPLGREISLEVRKRW